MTRFAQIVEAIVFKKVTYYTIVFEDADNGNNEFEDFILRHQGNKEVSIEYLDLLRWLKLLGEKYSALERYFRPEKKAEALPPPSRYLKEIYSNNLRLYCMRINNHIVILFNGGIKTTNKAQNCPNVKWHFETANKLAHQIDKLKGGEYPNITIDDLGEKLIIEQGTEIEI